MKGSCTLVASVLAASTTMALGSSSTSPEGFSSPARGGVAPSQKASDRKEKFVPRFDGLRFIETLVTAHR